nr:phosphoenolpyruvate synthase [Propionibacteriaceae bacterium]
MSEPTATEGDVPDRLVGELAEFGSEDLASAGGKGASLGELVRAGFPVPSGFVITTAAYARLLKSSGLELTPLLDEDATGAKIRSAVSSSPVPDDLTRAVVAAYRRLGSGAVAVRSSATAEDLPGAAFAGQQDSYLNVVGEEALIGALRDCWASLWTERAVSYRRRQGIEPTEIAMAVVVQNMVAADVAGVMFSANPVTGQRDEIVVDASRGLGEAVVSGRVTPDHYVLDSRGGLRCWTAGGHEVEIRAVEGGGTSDLAGDAGSEPLLSDSQLRQLAALGSRVAAHFGRPQDIE